MAITTYSHTTFAGLKALLAQRLSDPTNIFWADQELGIYLKESLRLFGLISNFYSDRDTFSTVSGQAFYNLNSALANDTLDFTVLDQDLVIQLKYMLMEQNPSSGSTWSTATSQTDQFTLADVTAALEKRRNQFLLETGLVITYTNSFNPGSTPINRVTLDNEVIDVRRVQWRTGAGQLSLVRKIDEFTANTLNSTWRTASANPPTSFSLAVSQPLVLQFISPSSVSGTLELLTINSPANLDPTIGVLLNIPDDFSPYIKWGALADLLGKDGQGKDQPRADYCEQRWKEGLEIAKIYKSVELITNPSNSNLWISSLRELDDFNIGWQNSVGSPLSVAMAGWNLLALKPVPNSIIQLTVDLTPNTPIPANDAAFVQIGKEHIDIVVSYGEHLARFKEAGTEFMETQGDYERMFRVALANNSRLKAIAQNIDVLRDRARTEERFRPRKLSEEEVA